MALWHRAHSDKCFFQLLITGSTPFSLLDTKSRVWDCHATCGHRKKTIFTFIVYERLGRSKCEYKIDQFIYTVLRVAILIQDVIFWQRKCVPAKIPRDSTREVIIIGPTSSLPQAGAAAAVGALGRFAKSAAGGISRTRLLSSLSTTPAFISDHGYGSDPNLRKHGRD